MLSPSNIPKEEANKALEKYRPYTLSRAVKLAKKEELYSDILQKDLEDFLDILFLKIKVISEFKK